MRYKLKYFRNNAETIGVFLYKKEINIKKVPILIGTFIKTY